MLAAFDRLMAGVLRREGAAMAAELRHDGRTATEAAEGALGQVSRLTAAIQIARARHEATRFSGREQVAGEAEVRKKRPVCIAVTIARSDGGTAVFILPITTQPCTRAEPSFAANTLKPACGQGREISGLRRRTSGAAGGVVLSGVGSPLAPAPHLCNGPCSMGGNLMNIDILIIGGGLAGIALADRVERPGRDWLLAEAQSDMGGRIMSPMIAGALFDLGPTWFWPGQPRMAALTERLHLRVFEQYSQGAAVFQARDGSVQGHRGLATMQGSLRVAGGMAALIDGLGRGLPGPNIMTGRAVTALRQTRYGISATCGDGSITARQVVLAVPPRGAVQTIAFAPGLTVVAHEVARAIPTWMAGQAKIIAVYDEPHWRKAGLSGDAMSQKGPMVELHDASPIDGGPYALFGFVGVPPDIRVRHEAEVIALALAQLQAMFGPRMAEPLSIRMTDWARVPQIATALDHTQHPATTRTMACPRPCATCGAER